VDRRKLGAVAGIVGSVAFVATFTIEGWLRPGYDAQRMFVSELALGPRGLVPILNFVACDFATILFARGMRAEFPAAPAATRLLHVVGVGLIGGGLFVMDPLGTPLGRLSWHGLLHGVFGAAFFYCAPIACFLFTRHFREAPRWRSLAGYTLGTGVVTIGLDHTTRPPWGGVVQRTHHILYFIWQAIVAGRLAGAGERIIEVLPPPPWSRRRVSGAGRRSRRQPEDSGGHSPRTTGSHACSGDVPLAVERARAAARMMGVYATSFRVSRVWRSRARMRAGSSL
jgi:hypothetical protein